MANDTAVDVQVPSGDTVDLQIRNQVNKAVATVVVNQVPKIAAEEAKKVVDARDAQRQRTEDVRANRRNRNRSLTLVVALLFTFAVPFFIANILHDPSLLKYAVGIAIFPDALITAYAWWRHY